MAAFYVNIAVRAAGANAAITGVEKSLRSLDDQAKRTGSTLRRVFGTLSTLALIGEFVSLTDTYTTLAGRIAVVTRTQAEANAVMGEAFRTADRVRVPVEAVVNTYSRLRQATETMGLSQRKTLAVTETLAEGLRVNGASASEAASTMRQFTQALSKGKLNGDEFISVMENSPAIIKLVAKELKVTRGELFAMAKGGKIGARTLVDALTKGADEIHEKFLKMPMTIGQALTVVRNNAIKFVGELTTTSGVAQDLAQAIAFVGRHFDTFGRIVMTVGQMVGGYFVRKGILSAIAGLRSLSTFVLANPFTALVLVIATAVAALISFGSQIELTANGAVTLADAFGVIKDKVIEAFAAIGEAVLDVTSSVIAMFSDWVTAADITSKDIVIFFAAMADSVVKVAVFLKDTIVVIFGGISATIASGFIQGVNKIIDAVNDLDIRFRKIKALFSGDAFDLKFETHKGGDIIPPRYDAAAEAKGTAGRYTTSRGDTVQDSKAFDFAGNTPKYTQAEAEAEAKKRGFPQEVFDIAQGQGITLNAAVAVAEQGYGNSNMQGLDDKRVDHIDNQYEGAWAATNQLADESFKRLGSSDPGAVQQAMEDLFDNSNRARKGLVDLNEAGKDTFKPIDTNAKKAADGFDKLLERLYPAIKAMNDLRDARVTVDKELAKGTGDPTISIEDGKRRISDLNQALKAGAITSAQYADALQEVADMTTKHAGSRVSDEQGNQILDRQRYLLLETADALGYYNYTAGQALEQSSLLTEMQDTKTSDFKAEIEARKELATLVEKGVVLSQYEIDARKGRGVDTTVDEKFREEQLANLRNSALVAEAAAVASDKASERNKRFNDRLKDSTSVSADYANQLQEIVEQYDAAAAGTFDYMRAVDELDKKFGILIVKDDAWKNALGAHEARVAQITAMREEIEKLGSTTALLEPIFAGLSTQIVSFVTTGKASFADLVNSILSDLTSLILKLIETKIMMALLGMGTGNYGSIVPAGPSGTIADGLIEPLGFAGGGSFRVAGQQGRDANIVPLALTRGERVTVENAGQQRKTDRQGSAPPRLAVNVFNSFDPGQMVPIIGSRGGQRQVYNVVQGAPRAVRRVR